MEERPGAELFDQAIHGRLDVLDDVGEMVGSPNCGLKMSSGTVPPIDSCSSPAGS